MKKFKVGQEIYIKDKNEADFIWSLLIKQGYCWNSGKKDFHYYKELPIAIIVNDYSKLSYSGFFSHPYPLPHMLTIEGFKKNLELE